MLASIDNFPVGRILADESDVESGENLDPQQEETESERAIGKRAIPTYEDFIAMFKPCARPAKSIASEEVATAPLYDVFVNLYQPKIDHRRSSMQMLRSIVTNVASDPALAKATKTVSLLILSREHRHTRFAQAATEMYSDALRCARQQLVNPNLDKIMLIGVGHMLSLCELFFSTALDDTGARPHTKWVISLIESCCRDRNFPITHPLRASPLRLFATWEALIVRYLPSGLRLPAEDPLSKAPGAMATLSDLTIITTHLLESCGDFCARLPPPNTPKILQFLNELIGIETKLHKLMTNYYESVTGAHYRLIATTVHHRPRILSLFSYTYDFADLEAAKLHIGYWMCLLALVDARRDVSRTYRGILDIELSEPFALLEKLANEYADHICMSIPFMGRPKCGWSGRVIAIRPLRFLLQHFRKRGDWQKLGWCVQCAADLCV